MHRDIKPQNLCFVDQNSSKLKIIGFSSFRKVEKGRNMSRRIGDPFYMAPEVIKKSYDQKCDI